jgi:predicted dehydrogenase
MSAEAVTVRVAIVGCGLIGSRWDMPGSAAAGGPSLSHAAAFSRQPGALIVGFCDTDIAKAQEAVARWGCGRAFGSAAALFDATAPDLVVVASHSSARAEPIAQALAAGVRTLVIEKPIATTLAQAQQLVRALEEHGALALVNYSRHWDPALADLRQRLACGELGRLQRLVGLYGKGLANNGSHMIDLVGLLCNARPRRARAWCSPLPADEAAWSQGSDLAFDAQVVFETAQGTTVQLDLLATDAQAFSCFELKLIGSQAVCEIRLGGRSIEWQPVQDDPHFAGYRVPGARQCFPARNLEAMDGMAAEALALARGERAAASCDARTALAAAAAVDALRRSAAADSPTWIAIEA